MRRARKASYVGQQKPLKAVAFINQTSQSAAPIADFPHLAPVVRERGLFKSYSLSFAVTATNGVGTSAASAASSSVTPVGPVPPEPTIATPVPTSPLWLLGIMAGLLSLVAVRRLRKA